ncbi:superoxide dismutase family protein [Pelagicoccus sp. SDUM812002]|uniref:superoxide dismutase family protein n=1 Tax=Pelagicoccus sp. SDUM812002 TaxID=3041266 RepID=UPI00280DD691|nr:superoxide dismutase family protein [Pelagicoccus sp. SDUM812002]MDQ8187590.1 superoxide dismutase family protein [Pelagicoccus sp. SDUM812002]
MTIFNRSNSSFSSYFIVYAVSLGAALITGCSPESDGQPDNIKEKNAGVASVRRIAEAHISPTEGHESEGVVTFIEEVGGIRVIADIRNLSINGRHGFHIHENGDCSAPDASSAGGHFNPSGEDHAGPDDSRRHVGDLGNLEATEAGSAMYVRVDEHLSFDGLNSIIGKAVVVHDSADDFKSQPSGAAGARIACGVIEWTENFSK